MQKLREVKKYVEEVLREKPYTRSSDNILYSCVIEKLGVPSDMSAAEFFRRAEEIGAPDVEAASALEEENYKEFAING